MRALPIIALVACATPRAVPVGDVEGPAITLPLPAPVQLGPIAHAADAYNVPVEAPSTPLRDAIAAAIVEYAHETGEPRRDAHLDLAAIDLADLVARGGAPIEAAVAVALHARGVIEPANKVIVSRQTTAETFFAEVHPQLDEALLFGETRFGIGGGGDQPLVVVVTHPALVTVKPIARVIAAHGELELAATLEGWFHDPHVTVTHDDARDAIDRPAIWKTDRWTFRTTIACGDHEGTAWVSIDASTDDNKVDLPLALFPIACGPAPEDAYRIEARAPVPDQAIARTLLAIINRERAASHLAILRGDRRADAAAQREVLLMQRSHSVAHLLGNTTTIARFRDANLMSPSSLEATLHATDVASAAEILMNERRYREILAHPEITHVGIAVAFDEHHELYIAIELVQIVEPVDTKQLEVRILAKINAKRDRLAQLEPDKLLTRLAVRYTEGRAAGWSDESMTKRLTDDTEFVFGTFIALRRALTLMLDGDFAKIDFGPPGKIDGIGISVTQSPRSGALTGRVWVIILYGRSR